jgi:hypothetical protein
MYTVVVYHNFLPNKTLLMSQILKEICKPMEAEVGLNLAWTLLVIYGRGITCINVSEKLPWAILLLS